MNGAVSAAGSATGSAMGSTPPSAALPSLAARHGQCLRWDDAAGCWWWADGASGSLGAWSLEGGPQPDLGFSSDAGGFALCRSGRLLVCQPKRLCFAAAPGLAVMPNLKHAASAPNTPRGRGPRGWRLRASGTLLTSATLCAVDPAEPRTSIHEGRTDRRGFFVFGTRNDGADGRPIASFYQYSLQHGLRRLALPAVSVATSICFSVDGRRMYFADGAKPSILQCDYDSETAGTANLRLFAQTGAMPEAAVVDRDGNLWNAQAGAGRLVRYAADGSLREQFAVPRGGPASPAFGGAGDRLMVATTDGLIAVAQAGANGVADALFDDN
jgi:L-arabinonolactonase